MLPASRLHPIADFQAPFKGRDVPPGFCLGFLDGLPFGLWVTDCEGGVAYLSPAFLDLLGMDLEECRRSGWTGRLPPEEAAPMVDKWRRCLDGGNSWEYQCRIRAGDGRYRHVLSLGSPMHDGQGNRRAWAGINLDITSLKETEQEFRLADDKARQREESRRVAQKLEVIGRLAGGVAHDFNNLLTAINGYSEILLSLLGSGHPLAGHVREIRSAGEKAASVTRQLLAFSRRQVLSPKALDLNRAVEHLLPVLARFLGAGIQVEFSPDTGLRKIKADPTQVEEVLLNLALNAKEAMPLGGRFIIGAENSELPPGEGDPEAGDPDGLNGPCVLLSVRDTGIGMDEETRTHIFEPFYSTKGVAHGLGLSAVYGIVKQSGGLIGVSSRPGQGALLRIYWPCWEDGKPGEGAVKPARKEDPVILVAADDEIYRNSVRDVLEREGYSVLVAGSEQDILEIGKRIHELDLLLVDQELAGTPGLEVAGRIRLQHPEAELLFMTRDPFTSADLLARIEACMAKRQACQHSAHPQIQ